MNELLILLAFEVLLFAFAFFMSNYDIMAPSVVMCVMFLLSTITAFINAKNWNINYSPDVVLILVSGIFAYMCGEVFYRLIFCGQLRSNFHYTEFFSSDDFIVKSWKLDFLIIFNIIVCLWNLQNITEIVSESVTDLNSLFVAYRRIGISNLAHGGKAAVSSILNQFLKVTIASGYVAGYLFANNLVLKSKRILEQIKLFIIIILSLLPGIMSGGRSGILRLISSIVIEYYIIWHQKNGWYRNLSWKYICYGISGFIIAVPSFYYSLSLLGRKTSRTIFTYVSDYLGSSIALFNLYIETPIQKIITGEESLYSVIKVLNYLGLSNASTSYNLEFRSLTAYETNVYTFFRRPLHDFGLIGMYIFTIAISFLFSWIYYKKIRYKKKKNCILWCLLYGYLFYWIILSSIDQYSQTYISAGTVLTVAVMFILFKFMTAKRCEKSIKRQNYGKIIKKKCNLKCS